MKNIKKFKIYFLIIFVIGIFSGCKKFLDINTDPNNPTKARLNILLSAAQGGYAFRLGWSPNGLGQPASTFVHQLVNFRVNNYDINTQSFDNEFQTLYADGLKDLQTVIDQATEENAPRYAGVAKIQKAFIFSILVDIFGDVPYFEALKGPDLLYPKTDAGKDIYADLFKLIDEGVANLDEDIPTAPVMGADDLIYGGNMTKWKRFANSLKLKMYNQIRLDDKDLATAQIQALIDANNFITAADDFEFNYGINLAPENRNPGFQVDYVSPGRENYISGYFYNIMKTQLNDPRVRYYFFTQTKNVYVGRVFGDIRAANVDQNTRTLPGLYPIGGKYDDGKGGKVTGSSGKGDVALRMLTSFSVKFILAEAALKLGTSGDVKTLFETGMREAFNKVNAIALKGGAPTILPATIDTYVNARLAEYDLADEEGKLALIIQQKWIAEFGYGIDSYTDYRRTGYPKLFDPNVDDADDLTYALDYPVRFPYSETEISTNPNAPKPPKGIYEVVFWDK